MKLARFGVLLCALGAACAEAGGEVKGGELTAPGAQAVVPGQFDNGEVKCDGEPTWSALYKDVFGPTKRPGSCSLEGFCHGNPGGDEAHGHFECFDEKACRESLIAHNLVTPGDAKKPEKAILLGVLRTTKSTGGIMPQQPPSFVFPDACIDRFKKWVANGVQAD